MSDQPNAGDQISDDLGKAADIVDAVNQAGVQTGKTSVWLRVGSMFASLGGAIARLVKGK